MNGSAHALCSGIALLAFLNKARVLRVERSVIQVSLVAHFLLLLVVFVVTIPPVWKVADRAIGIVGFSGLVLQTATVLMAVCQQSVMLHLAYGPTRARRKTVPRMIAVGAALLAMTVLFSHSGVPAGGPGELAVAQTAQPPAGPAVYLVTLVLSQTEVGVLGWRYSRFAPSPWLRRGLLTVALALPFTLVYAGASAFGIVEARLGDAWSSWGSAAQAGATAAVILQVLGWNMPDWGPRLTAVGTHLRHRRIYRALTPLHAFVTTHVPEPVVPVGPEQDVRTRLYRMAIEIRDAQWSLRIWMDAETARRVREEALRTGLRGEELAAAVEAAQLERAIEAKLHDRPPTAAIETPVSTTPGDLSSELTFLLKLARAMSAPLAVPRSGSS